MVHLCLCSSQIVLKGMKAPAKVQLIKALQLPELLLAFSQESIDSDELEDFALQVARVCNDVVVVLATCWAELASGDDAVVSHTSAHDAAGSHASSVESSPTRRRAPGSDAGSNGGAGGVTGGGSSRSIGRHAAQAAPLTPAQRQAQEDCYAVMERCLPLLFRLVGSTRRSLCIAVFSGAQAFVGVVQQPLVTRAGNGITATAYVCKRRAICAYLIRS